MCMKKYILTAILVLASAASVFAKQYQVENVYQKSDAKSGTLVIDKMGNEREAKYILVPAVELKQGEYKVQLRRENTNLYEVKNEVSRMKIYIKTKSCYESGYSIEAILVVKSNYGSNRFELIIPDNR